MILVYIDTKTNYYSRYSGRTCTHRFLVESAVDPQRLENLRTCPESWEQDIPGEAA